MDPRFYNSLVIDRLSKYPCYIKYRSSIYSFERPFRLADPRDLPQICDGNVIVLKDCLTDNIIRMQFSDILTFSIQHENDVKLCESALKEKLDGYQKTFSQFTYLRGRRLHDLFFRSDLIESDSQKIRNLKILDKLQLDDLEDYTDLLRDKPEIVAKMKKMWTGLILEKYKQTVQSIDEEIKTTEDENIKAELNSIKEILASIPADVDREISSKTTCDEITAYWPTLLLPRSEIFDLA